MRAYTTVFAQFVFFLIRANRTSAYETSAGYSFPMSDKIMERVEAIMETLDSEDDADRDQGCVEDLLLHLLSEHPREAHTDNYCYPIQRFLCLYHLQRDGGFQQVHKITKTLAALQWVFRAVLFSNISSTFDRTEEWDLRRRTK